MMGQDTEKENMLKAENVTVQHVEPIGQPRDIDNFEPWFVDM